MNVKYTTTLPRETIEWLTSYAKESNTRANKVLQELLEQKKELEIRRRLVDGFRRMGKDSEMVALADEGLDETLRLIEEYEKD